MLDETIHKTPRVDPDQWKSGGNCPDCRRAKYCTKTCSAHKKQFQRQVAGVLRGGIAKALERTGYIED